MNTKSHNRVLDVEVHNVATSLHFITMWTSIEKGDFESAMTSQLLYLVNQDEREELLESFSDKDYDVGMAMIDTMYGE